MNRTIRSRLEILHHRVLFLDRLQGVATLLMVSTMLLLGAIGLDWLVRWPMAVRIILLLAGVGMAIRALQKVIIRRWSHAPSVVSTALRIERIEPRLRGLLASALEFEDQNQGLQSAVVQSASDGFDLTAMRSRVRHVPALAATLGLLALLALVMTWMWVEPQGALVGLRRTLTPWTQDRWLPRVVMESDWKAVAVARGSRIPFRVRVTQGDAPNLRVRARCVTWVGNEPRDEREVELIRQPDGSLERPIQADGDQMILQAFAGDGFTDPLEMKVVTAPSITSGSVEIAPPEYATGARPVIASTWKRTAIENPGSILEGSRVRLRIQLDAPAIEPRIGSSVQLSSTDGKEILETQAVATAPDSWEVSTTLRTGTRITIDPIDASGVRAIEPLHITFDVVPDAAPSVSVIQPQTDEIVTSSAKVPFQVQARDELQLASVGWTLERQQRSGEPGPLALASEDRPVEGTEGSIESVLDVGSMKVRSGDTLLLRGRTNDRFRGMEGARPAIVSEPRRLRLVDREVLERQVRQQASSLRQLLDRLQVSQKELLKEPDAAARARSQVSLTDRIRQSAESAEGMSDRLRRNALDDTPISDSMRETTEAIRQAQTSGERAQDAAHKAQAGDAQSEARTRSEQESVIENLEKAISILDQDDDSAAMQRRAERLFEAIESLRKALQDASRGSAGKSANELSSAERQALQEQASRQRMVADETSAMLEDLRDRAQRAQERDPAQGRSMQQAAEEGERGQAARRMDEAAERTDRNQTAAADESMQRAAEAVMKVRESLRQDRRARTEDLRRRLSSLLETIRALIAAAETQIPRIDALALDQAPQSAPIVQEMLRIATNTAAASEDARQGDRALASIASIMLRASDRFEATAESLQKDAPDAGAARESITRGIDLLREASQKATEEKAKQDKAAADRERADLSRQYQDLAQRLQVSREAGVATIPAAGARVDRRGAAVQREQALVIDGIARDLRNGPAASGLVSEIDSFRTIHQRTDRDLSAVRDAMQRAEAGSADIRKIDISIEALKGLAIALKDPEPGDEPFMEGQQRDEGGQGGGAGGENDGKLPPITELRVVRQMQEQVNQLTRSLDEARAAGQTIDRELADLAVMQDDVRRLGESWVQRMREDRRGSSRGKTDDADRSRQVPGFQLQGLWQPQEPAAQVPTPPQPGATPNPPAKSRTLDELLGIESGSPQGEVAARRRDRKLDRALNESDLDDLATAAEESLSTVDELVGDRKDIGIETQRAQAEALANIDALLDAATRFQKGRQGSSSSSSASQSSEQSGSRDRGSAGEQRAGKSPSAQRQAGASSMQDNAGGREGENEPPPPEDAIRSNGLLQEGRIEWGSLPSRVREIMTQARRDRVSALYQEATEAYYRRLAEGNRP